MDDSDLSSAVSAAGVLISRSDGRTLMVRTHHRTSLVMPGGMVEEGESPAVAAEREVREEVGLDVRVTRLLAVQHKAADDRAPERYLFDFDCEPLAATPLLRLQADEIAELLAVGGGRRRAARRERPGAVAGGVHGAALGQRGVRRRRAGADLTAGPRNPKLRGIDSTSRSLGE
jgi:ADP-ribose pyrophosphatase YjhB (NUDIX family)